MVDAYHLDLHSPPMLSLSFPLQCAMLRLAMDDGMGIAEEDERKKQTGTGMTEGEELKRSYSKPRSPPNKICNSIIIVTGLS